MCIRDLQTKLGVLFEWQENALDGVEIPIDDRSRIYVGLLHLAHEHEKAIEILVVRKLYGSVFALIRPLFEAYLRAIWLLHCANDKEYEQFKRGKLEKILGELIEDIEKVDKYGVGVLSDIKESNWKLMNDFTHGGISQALSRNRPNAISSNYPDQDIISAINFAASIGLMATMEIAYITNNKKLVLEVLDKMKGFR